MGRKWTVNATGKMPIVPVEARLAGDGSPYRAVTRRRKKRAGVAVAGIVVLPEGSSG